MLSSMIPDLILKDNLASCFPLSQIYIYIYIVSIYIYIVSVVKKVTCIQITELHFFHMVDFGVYTSERYLHRGDSWGPDIKKISKCSQ